MVECRRKVRGVAPATFPTVLSAIVRSHAATSFMDPAASTAATEILADKVLGLFDPAMARWGELARQRYG